MEYASAKLGGRAGSWSRKRGVYRNLLLKHSDSVIWMLTMYPKNVIEDIPAHLLRQIREEIENG